MLFGWFFSWGNWISHKQTFTRTLKNAQGVERDVNTWCPSRLMNCICKWSDSEYLRHCRSNRNCPIFCSLCLLLYILYINIGWRLTLVLCCHLPPSISGLPPASLPYELTLHWFWSLDSASFPSRSLPVAAHSLLYPGNALKSGRRASTPGCSGTHRWLLNGSVRCVDRKPHILWGWEGRIWEVWWFSSYVRVDVLPYVS